METNNIPTFAEQSEWWLNNIQSRRRNPAKPSSVTQFKSHLSTLLPLIGEIPLNEVNNRALKNLVPKLQGGPKTIQCRLGVIKSVVSSLLDGDGQSICKVKWNSSYIDTPNVINQKQPVFTSEQIADIVSRGNGEKLLYKCAAGSGLRIGELLALEPRHFKYRTLTVEQSQWGSIIQTPKTQNGYRQVDLCSSLAEELSEYLRGRETGFIFQEPRTYGGMLAKLHTILNDLKIPQTGFHAFRRFRTTHLRKKQVPENLIRFWIGHADKSITDLYDRVSIDTEFRLEQAEKAGLGF